MRVLSLFDGLGGARIALDRLGIEVEYFASEIDKYAIKVARKNYPDIKYLGPVETIAGVGNVDLLIGGSPCQGFSVAGKQNGFSDIRSKLFYEYVRLLRVTKPKYFLLENVKMKKEWVNVITEELGVEPVEINSSLLTAQSRKRLYWANFPITLPEECGITLQDILEEGITDGLKSYCIDANYHKGTTLDDYFNKHRRQVVFSPLRVGSDLSTVYEADQRIYSYVGKSPTIRSGNPTIRVALDKENYRLLTPLECERLQGVPDNYTEGVSKTQRYKMLGNGFTVPVIKHILKGIV